MDLFERPLVRLGREVCGDLGAALRREWLTTNGLGGYASSTVAGVNTRRYHGLLVAALAPPVERTVLAAGLVDEAAYGGRRYPLATHKFCDCLFDPLVYLHIQSFHLEGMLPVWTFAAGDALLERRIWMAHGRNTTYVRYAVLRGSQPVDLAVAPLLTCRDIHHFSTAHEPVAVFPMEAGVWVTFGDGPPLRMVSEAAFQEAPDWYWNFRHREEAERGEDRRSDLFLPGRFTARLAPGEAVSLVLTAEEQPPEDAEKSLEAERARQRGLLTQAGAETWPALDQQLVLAADQFVVSRHYRGKEEARPGATVMAGYHWFNDWGRDTMISLPGLLLSTGRYAEAAETLRVFASYVKDGLIPNNFPDHPEQEPAYNTADATLWFFVALLRYGEATGDADLVSEVLPKLVTIVERHLEGTRFGIGADALDGLLCQGAEGLQLTWMDAKVGEWVVTPRRGKVVEINGLWYNALRILGRFLEERGMREHGRYAGLAERVRASFLTRFLSEDVDWLADVVDGDHGDDWSLRPNQVLALSLPYPLLEGGRARSALAAVGRQLLTTYGLRSLSPENLAYRGTYIGGIWDRDGAYHQGSVWTWLIGPYAEAVARLASREEALSLLLPFEDHLRDAGLGSVSEILDGDPPHFPRGCIAQAWGVAEVLRMLRALRG